ncbi:hypothetical protein CMV_001480 [Castanea mollissima]|uniref:Uncharacterized protein n=1 Tax=Castanea mollissima TaxID=60419 RepID=A0A8J4VXZ5_9ROSI|nr:hypothetical protein CMV_001480 [Castanea mollissima]
MAGAEKLWVEQQRCSVSKDARVGLESWDKNHLLSLLEITCLKEARMVYVTTMSVWRWYLMLGNRTPVGG